MSKLANNWGLKVLDPVLSGNRCLNTALLDALVKATRWIMTNYPDSEAEIRDRFRALDQLIQQMISQNESPPTVTQADGIWAVKQVKKALDDSNQWLNSYQEDDTRLIVRAQLYYSHQDISGWGCNRRYLP